MIRAVIFDMDGVIVESESLHSKACRMVLEEYGKKPIYHENGLIQTLGLTDREDWVNLKKKYQINESLEILLKKKRKAVLNLFKRNLAPLPGVIRLLESLKRDKILIGLASSSVMSEINAITSSLKVKNYFKVIISGDHVKYGKPNPEIYLLAAKKLNLEPKNCVALEDTEKGVSAAFNAGMKVIAIPHQYSKNQDFSKADLVINSLEDITWDIISKL